MKTNPQEGIKVQFYRGPAWKVPSHSPRTLKWKVTSKFETWKSQRANIYPYVTIKPYILDIIDINRNIQDVCLIELFIRYHNCSSELTVMAGVTAVWGEGSHSSPSTYAYVSWTNWWFDILKGCVVRSKLGPKHPKHPKACVPAAVRSHTKAMCDVDTFKASTSRSASSSWRHRVNLVHWHVRSWMRALSSSVLSPGFSWLGQAYLFR